MTLSSLCIGVQNLKRQAHLPQIGQERPLPHPTVSRPPTLLLPLLTMVHGAGYIRPQQSTSFYSLNIDEKTNNVIIHEQQAVD